MYEDAKLRKEALRSKFEYLFLNVFRRILAPQSKSDTETYENACTMCGCGLMCLGWVVSDFTNTLWICELVIPRAIHLSKI